MTAPATPSERLARIVAGLRGLVAAQGLARGLAGPLIILVCARLHRLVARFAAQAEAPSAHQSRPTRPARHFSPPLLPRRFAWLIRWLPGAAAAGSQLRHLLDDPEMIAVIQSRPAAGRALRPLCHLLGIRPPPGLRRPRHLRQRPAQPARPRRKPAPSSLPPLDLSALPVPPGHFACIVRPDLRLDTS